jgi:hypothetical protein
MKGASMQGYIGCTRMNVVFQLFVILWLNVNNGVIIGKKIYVIYFDLDVKLLKVHDNSYCGCVRLAIWKKKSHRCIVNV